MSSFTQTCVTFFLSWSFLDLNSHQSLYGFVAWTTAMWTLFKMLFCFTEKSHLEICNGMRVFISENLLTLNSKWPRACRKLSSSREKASMASRDVSGFLRISSVDLAENEGQLCFEKSVQTCGRFSWNGEVICLKDPASLCRPLKRAFEDSCQWTNQNEQNQI